MPPPPLQPPSRHNPLSTKPRAIQARLRELFTDLGQYGPVMFTVDQPRTIGALPVTVTQAIGLAVTYLPGLAMRRIADVYPGNVKTDARDAYIIADAARTLPATLRAVEAGDEQTADLAVLAGLDDDLAAECTRLANQIRGLLVDVHLPWSGRWAHTWTRSVGPAILVKFGGPVGITTAGHRALHTLIRKHPPRSHQKVYQQVVSALKGQTVVVPGPRAADQVLRVRGRQLLENMAARTHRSGTPISGEHQQYAGNKRLNVPRQVVGRISSVSKVGIAGSARLRCTSSGRFQEIAS